jgi:hypothetical protein
MAGAPPVSPKVQFTSSTGAPLANGSVTVYLAGTTTLTDTWQDKDLETLNTNPITLDARGEALVWLDTTKTYKFLLKNAGGQTQWTVDNITTTVAFATHEIDQFVGTGSQVAFTLSTAPGSLNSVTVVINGLTMKPTTDYTVSGTTLTFTTAPALSDEIMVRYGRGITPGAATDANDVNYQPAGTGAVATTVQAKLREQPSTSDISDGVSLAALNQAIANITNGRLLIPPGDYSFSGDILIQSKVAGSGALPYGSFELYAAGVRFSGTGKIIVDSCKRVKITGLDAPGFDLHWRGCWWSKFEGMRYRSLVMGDVAGTSFSSNYWNEIEGGLSQSIVVHASATGGCNAHQWTNHSMRGNANQGFTGTANYAIEFNGNVDAQAWKFVGGDISYHNTAIYTVGGGNSEDIEVDFYNVYFDSDFPVPLSRDKSRIATHDCHAANDIPFSATMSAAARGPQHGLRQDRAAGWSGFSSINFVPNGDLRVGLPTYAGAGLPVGASGGATITAATTAGPFSRYLNVNQAGTSGTTRFRPKALPFTGRYCGVLVIRNAAAGSRTIRLGFNNLYEVATISDTEWSLYSLTSGTDIAAAAQPDIQILTNDATAFSVDVAYAGVFFGETPPIIALASPYSEIVGSATYNPPDILNGAQTTTTVTATGAALGDSVVPSFGIDLQGIVMTAYVSAADTVTVTLRNDTGGAINLASSTLRVRVTKNAY